MINHVNLAIYLLDRYAMHLIPEVRQALWKRDHYLIQSIQNWTK